MYKFNILREELASSKKFTDSYGAAQQQLFMNLRIFGEYRRGLDSQENRNIGIVYSTFFGLPFRILTNIFTRISDGIIFTSIEPFEILLKVGTSAEFEEYINNAKMFISSEIGTDCFINSEMFYPILANFIAEYYIKEIEACGVVFAEAFSSMYNTRLFTMHHGPHGLSYEIEVANEIETLLKEANLFEAKSA